MNYIYLILIIFGLTFQNVIKKPYTQKFSEKGSYFFSLVTSIGAMAFFALTLKSFKWDFGVLVYSAAFALAYTAALLFTVKAVACDSLSLTSLLISYSLFLPTFYGLIFLKEPISKGFIPGIILMVISIFLSNKKEETSAASSKKWFLFILLAFVGNGMCSVVQKMQQIAFSGEFKNEFMLIALGISSLILLFFTVKEDSDNIKPYMKSGLKPALACGVANGAVNLFVMILSGRMAASVMFPLVSVGGIAATYLTARLHYKENLGKSQTIGFVIGLFSVFFLNI